LNIIRRLAVRAFFSADFRRRYKKGGGGVRRQLWGIGLVQQRGKYSLTFGYNTIKEYSL